MKISKSVDLAVFWFVGIPLVVYANSFLGDFQFDDFDSILNNSHLQSWDIYLGHLDHMVRPVLYATFLVDRLLYADVAWGYHAINVGLHLISGILVYCLILRASKGEVSFIAFWSALLFLIHPLATETVTYLSGRTSGLMTCFYLLALLWYLKGTEERSRNGIHQGWYGGALLVFLLALASKETAVTFPLAI